MVQDQKEEVQVVMEEEKYHCYLLVSVCLLIYLINF